MREEHADDAAEVPQQVQVEEADWHWISLQEQSTAITPSRPVSIIISSDRPSSRQSGS